jgi:hypothetical protein
MRGSVLARLRAVRDRLRFASLSYGLREWPRELAARHDQVTALIERLVGAAQPLLADRRRRLVGFDGPAARTVTVRRCSIAAFAS